MARYTAVGPYIDIDLYNDINYMPSSTYVYIFKNIEQQIYGGDYVFLVDN